MSNGNLLVLQKINQNIDGIDFDFKKAAKQIGFSQRAPKKIFPEALFKSLCLLTFQVKVSFASWATILSLNVQHIISKQAINKRINRKFVMLMKMVLAAVIQRNAKCEHLKAKGLFSTFTRVVLQDSTTIKVPQPLRKVFPGSSNQTKKCANMRIQAIFDIIGQHFISFELSPFTKNDQAASPDILKYIKAGDVIIRDLGYFALHVLRKIADIKEAYFLSRYRFKTGLYSTKGDNVNLLNMLEKGCSLDISALLGKNEHIPVRLIASPVPQEVANVRRMKLKNNRDKRLKPTKEQLALLDWEIFITNVPKSVWDTKDIGTIYGLRWRIEIIFKTWKSHFKLGTVPNCKSKHYLESVIYARLIVILLFYAVFATLHLQNEMKNGEQKQLSLLRISSFITTNFWILFAPDRKIGNNNLLEKLIYKICAYDKRKRQNYEQTLLGLIT